MIFFFINKILHHTFLSNNPLILIQTYHLISLIKVRDYYKKLIIAINVIIVNAIPALFSFVIFSLNKVRAIIIENSTTPILFNAITNELLNVRVFNAFIKK